MGDLSDETQAMQLPAGCGRFPREALELAALARTDPDVPIDERLAPHLVMCKRCTEAIDRFAADNAFLGEFKAIPTPSSNSRALSRSRPVAGVAGTSDEVAGPIPGYSLGDEIHRGGQGAVYRAEQLATRRSCAVKMLLGGKFASDVQRVRFEREVEVVAALRHPSIVTLYESGVSRSGEPWFAMELVDGERLDEYVRRLRLDARGIARLMQKVADAIAYAHRRGVIHRDLKPGNILVDREGVPRILDFGLARADAPDAGSSPGSGTTLVGEFLGTFAYAAPEQLSGDPTAIDSRCDLYAIGVVFYECLTGRRPFDGAKSIGELVIQKTMRTPERPSALVSGIDHDFDVITLRLLAADAANRYDTADALAEDLARALDGRPILAREDSKIYVLRRNLRRHWIATSAAAVVLATIIASSVALAVAYANAEQARARAESQLDAVLKALEESNPETGDGTSAMLATEFIAYVEKSLEAALASEPTDLARLLRSVGLIHLGFGNLPDAATAIERAYAIESDAYSRGEIDAIAMSDSAYAVARVRFRMPQAGPDFAGSERAYREAIELRESVTGPEDLHTIDLIRQLSSTLRRQRKLEEAESTLRGAMARSAGLPPSREKAIFDAAALNASAGLASDRGELQLALVEYQRALETLRPHVEPNNFRVGVGLLNIARTKMQLDQWESALPDAEASLRILRERKGDRDEVTLRAANLVMEIKRIVESRSTGGEANASGNGPP